MKSTVLFRRVLFGGFRRDDVLTYVEKLEEENEKLQLTRNDEINRLQEELESYKADYDELSSRTSLRISQLEAQLNEFQDEANRIIVQQRREAEEILQGVKSRVAVAIAQDEDIHDKVIKLKKMVG